MQTSSKKTQETTKKPNGKGLLGNLRSVYARNSKVLAGIGVATVLTGTGMMTGCSGGDKAHDAVVFLETRYGWQLPVPENSPLWTKMSVSEKDLKDLSAGQKRFYKEAFLAPIMAIMYDRLHFEGLQHAYKGDVIDGLNDLCKTFKPTKKLEENAGKDLNQLWGYELKLKQYEMCKAIAKRVNSKRTVVGRRDEAIDVWNTLTQIMGNADGPQAVGAWFIPKRVQNGRSYVAPLQRVK